jgi:hypothetical protein
MSVWVVLLSLDLLGGGTTRSFDAQTSTRRGRRPTLATMAAPKAIFIQRRSSEVSSQASRPRRAATRPPYSKSGNICGSTSTFNSSRKA